ncbi:MAG: cell division protein FtsZ [Clostridia bacterium]|nr:cell division protein FtsZ [Clostridia bacterium]MEE1024040.1 cell division protein FtsZ [Acutalibacteraceae bacterium]
MPFEISNEENEVVSIKVVGVGGGGGNAVTTMINAGVKGAEFVVVNSDKAAILKSQAQHKVQIGEKLTHGMGAGANPEVGQGAAEESKDDIINVLKGTDMVFITAGMGGGTGTGAAPVVAQIAKEMGILTVGVVTKPFSFEGQRRMKQAEKGIAELSQHVDCIIVIPNERLKLISEQKITLKNAFLMADDILRQGVQSISELVSNTAEVNLDFADVTTVLKDSGYAHMGVGYGEGRDKAETAAHAAITSPLIETSMNGAHGIIISITASPDIGLDEVTQASTIISEAAHPDANIIWGLDFDESMEDAIKITVIATGSSDAQKKKNDTFAGLETDDSNDFDVISIFNR